MEEGHDCENCVRSCGHTDREHREGIIFVGGRPGHGDTRPVVRTARCA